MSDIPTREMVQCQVTGRIVPVDECEYIVIRILKHKDASMDNFNPLGSTKVSPVFKPRSEGSIDTIENRQRLEDKPTVPAIELPDGVDPKNAVVLTAEEMAPTPKMRSVIPPGILAVMRPANTPGSAQEVRNV